MRDSRRTARALLTLAVVCIAAVLAGCQDPNGKLSSGKLTSFERSSSGDSYGVARLDDGTDVKVRVGHYVGVKCRVGTKVKVRQPPPGQAQKPGPVGTWEEVPSQVEGVDETQAEGVVRSATVALPMGEALSGRIAPTEVKELKVDTKVLPTGVGTVVTQTVSVSLDAPLRISAIEGWCDDLEPGIAAIVVSGGTRVKIVTCEGRWYLVDVDVSAGAASEAQLHALVQALRSGDEETSESAKWVLHAMKDERALPALDAIARDPKASAGVREDASWVAGSIRNSD